MPIWGASVISLALLALSVPMITGRPEALHVWWDRGDRGCFECKFCLEPGARPHHRQSIQHPRLWKAGWGACGGALILWAAVGVGAIVDDSARRRCARGDGLGESDR